MLVQSLLRQDPFSGHLFLFGGRKANLIKIVFWDGTGLCLFTKRLEHGVFLWPSNVELGGTLMLNSAQLSLLIFFFQAEDGIRDKLVTGVQTCALPISKRVANVFAKRFASKYTDIFSSLLLAQKLFYDETRRKVLILMSDMIEDSPPYNFEKVSWSPATTEKTLSELDAKGLIPKLAGVCIYVSGASAPSAELAENIGRFWYAYFRRAGADMEPSRYAHVLLHWPPSNSCHSTT